MFDIVVVSNGGPAAKEWRCSEQGNAGVQEEGMTKVVLARRTDVDFTGRLRSLDLLQTLQVRILFCSVLF